MRTLYILVLFLSSLAFSCKHEPKEAVTTENKELTILEKVAHAHGFEAWKTIKEIEYTFNVDRDTTHFERRWKWNPNTNVVTANSAGNSITFNRNAIDSTAMQPNAAFINDKYWLLAPFNLVWDSANFAHEHKTKVAAPISKKDMQMLTITYGPEGGITPGDAYDFYFEDDYVIKEWVFRKGNQKEASMTTSWKKHKDHNGILIAMEHTKDDAPFTLYFTDVKTVLK